MAVHLSCQGVGRRPALLFNRLTSEPAVNVARSVARCRHHAVLTILLLACSASPADADFFLTPFAAIKFGGNAAVVDLESGASNTKFMIGAAAGVLGDGLLGVEADVGYAPRFFERSTGSLVIRSHVLTVMGNVMVAVPRRISAYSLRPFVSGGAGLMHLSIEDLVEALPVDNTLFAVNVGGGAIGPISRVMDVRFDLRWFKSVTTADISAIRSGTALSFWRFGVGVSIR